MQKAGSVGWGNPWRAGLSCTGPVSPAAGPSYKARLDPQCMKGRQRTPWGELPMDSTAGRRRSGYFA